MSPFSVLSLVIFVLSFLLHKSCQGFINFISLLKRGHSGFTAPLYYILFIYLFLGAAPHSLWDLSSLTRDRTWALSCESVES